MTITHKPTATTLVQATIISLETNISCFHLTPTHPLSHSVLNKAVRMIYLIYVRAWHTPAQIKWLPKSL